MSTYTQIHYQIVFSTKNGQKVLINEHHEKLFGNIWEILKTKGLLCAFFVINNCYLSDDPIINMFFSNS